jgi:O-antigen ligase
MRVTTSRVRQAARRAAPFILVGVIAWPAVAFGGVYPWTYEPLIGLCALFVLCVLVSCPWMVDTALLACALGVAVAVAIQLLPFTPTLLRAVSPAGLTFFEQQNAAYALSPAAVSLPRPLSINPQATSLFLWFFLSMVGLFAGIVSLGAAMPLRFVATSVSGIGAMLAFVGIIQAGSGTDRMYGVWAPETATAVFGPFVNRNHFAAWMLMALPVTMMQCAAQIAALDHGAGHRRTAVGLLGSARASQTVLTAGASLLMSIALLMTRSRSAIGGFLAVVAAVAWMQFRRRSSMRAAMPVAVYALTLACAAVVWIGWRPLIARLNELPGGHLSGRLDAWREALRIAHDFWLTGSGMNTYATAILSYHDPRVLLFFRTPHNDYLQALCDGGLIVAAPLAAMLGLLIIGIARASSDRTHGRSVDAWTRYGAIVGLSAVAVQELVDFGLQTPANAVLFTVLTAYATAPVVRSSADSSRVIGSR